MIWFHAKVTYQREDETGSLKTQNESYLVDAMSYTEAESRIAEAMAANLPEYKIKIDPKKLAEVIEIHTEDPFFIGKVQYITYDEKKSKEKRTNYNIAIQAPSIENALAELKTTLGTLNDYEIVGMSKSPILEVIHSRE